MAGTPRGRKSVHHLEGLNRTDLCQKEGLLQNTEKSVAAPPAWPYDPELMLLKYGGLLLMKGTIVDSTLIAAPSSTKNQKKERNPDSHQVKIGSQRFFGYKRHIVADRDAGPVNKVETTAASAHDTAPVQDFT